jgi:hypothetical protein
MICLESPTEKADAETVGFSIYYGLFLRQVAPRSGPYGKAFGVETSITCRSDWI